MACVKMETLFFDQRTEPMDWFLSDERKIRILTASGYCLDGSKKLAQSAPLATIAILEHP